MHIIYKVLLYFCGHVCILNVLDFPYYNVLWNMITSFWYSHYCSVAKSCLTPCNPIESRMPKEKKKEKKRKESSMPGFLVLHYLWSLFKLTSIKSAMPSNHLKTIWFLFPFWFNSNETGIFFFTIIQSWKNIEKLSCWSLCNYANIPIKYPQILSFQISYHHRTPNSRHFF